MPSPSVKLNFFKLNTPDMARALAFYRESLGFAVTQTFDEADFVEHIFHEAHRLNDLVERALLRV